MTRERSILLLALLAWDFAERTLAIGEPRYAQRNFSYLIARATAAPILVRPA